MNNPFKKILDNSKETAKKWDNLKTTTKLNTVVCPRCGAPRPVNTDISICAYCRYKFMHL
jgi:hypothetical protein